MLDQNTDRMWYVIGAVIVGAAIIFLANGTLPSLFASVTDSFNESSEGAVGTVYDMHPMTGVVNPNIVNPDDLSTFRTTLVNYDDTANEWTLLLPPSPSWYGDGLRPNSNRIIVPYGETYTLSYEVYVPDGYEGLYAQVDIDNFIAGGSNVGWGMDLETRSINDNDAITTRFSNGRPHGGTGSGLGGVPKIPVTAGEWTRVWVTYTNASQYNVDEVALQDRTKIGVVNPTDETVEIKIRHVKGELATHPTAYSPYAP